MLLGCSRGPVCEAEDQVLVASAEHPLTCAQVADVETYIELLAGRPLQHNGRPRLPGALVAAHQADPVALDAKLAAIRSEGRRLEQGSGEAIATYRSEAVWKAYRGQGVIRSSDGELWNILGDAMSVWVWSDDERLALTEADIEGWLTYGSLCREAQGAGVMRISVSDRVTAYRVVVDRFEAGTRAEKLALAAMGPFWHQVRDRWQSASYERQQQWIASAPLPPPMTSTSLGYFEAVMQGDVAGHVAALHRVLGPLSLNRSAWRFDE